MDSLERDKSVNVMEDLAARIENIYGNLNAKLVTCIAKLDYVIDRLEPDEELYPEDEET